MMIGHKWMADVPYTATIPYIHVGQSTNDTKSDNQKDSYPECSAKKFILAVLSDVERMRHGMPCVILLV